MNVFESYVISIEDIPINKLLSKVTLRPTRTLIIMAVLSLLMIIFGNIYVRLLGIALLGLVAFSFYKTKNTAIMDIYEDFIVVFNEKYPGQCQLIQWDNITEWFYQTGTGGPDVLTIQLDTAEFVILQLYTPSKFMSIFMNKIRDKERRQKRLNEYKKGTKKFSFPWPWKKK